MRPSGAAVTPRTCPGDGRVDARAVSHPSAMAAADPPPATGADPRARAHSAA
eukprot:gene54076-18992_t